jgi:hypothetical protein
MFGLSKRERVAEALRRGTAAAVTGGFFHFSQVEALGLNDATSSWIYTDALAHQIFALGIIYSNAPACAEPWADAAFFNDVVFKALTDYEKSNNLTLGTTSSFIFRRIDDFKAIPREKLATGEHFLSTADGAVQRDPRANKLQISQMLKTATEAYFAAARRMFVG